MAIEDTRKRLLALYALRLASLMIVFDMTIVKVTLPLIKAHLGFLVTYGGFLLARRLLSATAGFSSAQVVGSGC